MNALLDEEFKAAAELIQPVSDATWVGVAGTTTSLAAMTLGLRQYTPESTHGYILSRQAVEDSVTQLSQADLQKTKELILETKRAPVILAGALILRGIMRHFALQEIIVSEHDILDGLAESAAHLAKQNR